VVKAVKDDLRLGLWTASGLLFDLGQITWTVSVVLDQGEMRCWKRPGIHSISYLSFPQRGNLDVWTRRELGHDLAHVLICMCKSGGVLISAVQPGQVSPFFSNITKSIGSAFTNLIIESLRLEKSSKIMKSKGQPNTTMTAKPCPEVPHLHVFLNTSRDGDSTTSLGSLFECLTTLSVKKVFLISNLNLP